MESSYAQRNRLSRRATGLALSSRFAYNFRVMPELETGPDAQQQLQLLHECLQQDSGFADVADAVCQGQAATLDGVWGSSCALVAAALAARSRPAPVVLVAAKSAEIDELLDSLRLFSPLPAVTYPTLEERPRKLIEDESYGDRLRTLKQLLQRDRAAFVVTSIQSLLQPGPDPATLRANTRWIRQGDRLDVEEVTRWLAQHRYHATSAVELPGEFSLRGGILDLFALDWLAPVRIELFGDEVESLRQFDVATQRSLAALSEVEITVQSARTETPSPVAAQGCLTQYLPDGSLWLWIEPDQIRAEARHFLELSERPQDCFRLDDLMRRASRFGSVHAAGLATGQEQVSRRLQIESVERFSGEIARVRQELDQLAAEQRVFLIGETDAEVKRLGEILASTQAAVSGRLLSVVGRLRNGFRLVTEATLVISGNELFHRALLRRTPRHHAGKAIDSFLELREGDLVVHLAHGIGRYRGLHLLQKEHQVEEHLEIEFHGGTKIFVPATKIELVQKYVGARKTRPRLATIGGKNWLRQKRAAYEAVQDLASDLLQLQAQREARPASRSVPIPTGSRNSTPRFPTRKRPIN